MTGGKEARAISIREILRELKHADPTRVVRYDFVGCVPTTVESWRGVYSEPALGWAATGYSSIAQRQPLHTVGDLVSELEAVVQGREHEGWKGGEFSYGPDQTLHVDNPGDCNHTMIVGVEIGSYDVTLLTAQVQE